jgi:plastocyanin
MITFNRDGSITPGLSVTIKAGTNVTWCNNDPFKPHGVVAINVQLGQYFGGRAFVIPYKQPYTVNFPIPGSFDYRTTFPPQMIGTITVTK